MPDTCGMRWRDSHRPSFAETARLLQAGQPCTLDPRSAGQPNAEVALKTCESSLARSQPDHHDDAVRSPGAGQWSEPHRCARNANVRGSKWQQTRTEEQKTNESVGWVAPPNGIRLGPKAHEGSRGFGISDGEYAYDGIEEALHALRW